MTPLLENISEAITCNVVPEHWLKYSYSTVKSFSPYVNDFIQRHEWFQKWWSSDEDPRSYWISAFFQPRGFLAAVKLNYARENSIPLDKIVFDATVIDNQYVNCCCFV